MNSLSTFLVIALASVAIAQDVTIRKALPGCERPCPRNLMPVCGFDGQHHKLFDNQCLLENEHCFNGRTWMQSRMNECLFRSVDAVIPNCEVPCTRELRPTCGFDGRTHKVFNNPCMLKNEHCKDGHEWFQTRMDDCTENTNKFCETPCTREMNPTCGFDGQHHQLFNNPCMMKNEHCKDGRTWVQTRMVDCLVRSNEKKVHLNICPEIYSPVCGFNGVEHKFFVNECTMRAFNKDADTNQFVKVANSECPEIKI